MQVVADRTKQYRNWRGWKQPELAERLQRAGLTGWNRSVVANFESGRRTVLSIDELLVLAYVLGVPPVMLFVPLGEDDEFMVTPLVATETESVLLWINGKMSRPDSVTELPGSRQPEAGDAQIWHRARIPLATYEQYLNAVHILREAETDYATQRALIESRDSETTNERERLVNGHIKENELLGLMKNYLGDQYNALKLIGDALNGMVRAGLVTPVVPHQLFQTLVSSGRLEQPDRVRTGDTEPEVTEHG